MLNVLMLLIVANNPQIPSIDPSILPSNELFYEKVENSNHLQKEKTQSFQPVKMAAIDGDCLAAFFVALMDRYKSIDIKNILKKHIHYLKYNIVQIQDHKDVCTINFELKKSDEVLSNVKGCNIYYQIKKHDLSIECTGCGLLPDNWNGRSCTKENLRNAFKKEQNK